MAASRSTRVTRSTVGLNGLDETFCGRTLRNRSIAHPEEVFPQSLLRSRSPKKRPEPIQIQKGNISKNSELKQTGQRESWVSPRKRGLSVSEKDSSEKDSEENSEISLTEQLSPVLKKIKLLHSQDSVGLDEEIPSQFPNDSTESRNSGSDNETDTTPTKRSNRCLLLDDSDKREVKKETEPEELSNSVTENIFNHQTVNGVDGKDTAALTCNDCPSDGSIKQNNNIVLDPSKELTDCENGSTLDPCSVVTNNKKDTLSDHNVPCTNSEEQGESQDHKLINNCLPSELVNQASELVTGSCIDTLSTVRDSEEEVDVVGESASKEHIVENSDSLLRSDHEDSTTGEPESGQSLNELDSVCSEVACFSDTQEHRYTLRTSPRRPGSCKDSPCKSESLVVGQEHVEENISNQNSETNVNGCLELDEVVKDDKKLVCKSEKCSIDEQTRPSSDIATVTEYMPAVKEGGSVQVVEEEEDPDVYYFESDHVALKHSKDYQRLLQTISVLEAQRSQAVQDLESLGRRQREALVDPIGFVEKLQKKMDIGIPHPQRIVQVPDITWDQYTTSLGNFERELRNRKRNSRRVRLIFDKAGLTASPQKSVENMKDGESASYSVLPQSDGQEGSTSSHSQIKGRLCAETKTGTFNLLWTVEEQKKLEMLLLKFPPEEVESRRWQKIADELGNRTAKQVASRVQKYFIKLTKAGIPVPGRTPNLYMYSKKSLGKRHHILNKHLFRPSTFMTSHEPPVFMDEDDDRSSFTSRDLDAAGDDEISDEETIPLACHDLAEYKELLELKKLKKQKLLEMKAESGFVQHIGFKCDNCETEPIQGIRWHCQDCPQRMSVDFCDSCSDCLYETETHKENHHLEPIYRAETFLDRDYCMPHSTSYNYLDPNYFPANR
ncbi:ZZ-type zinc finger-containing protein 3 [Bombina bombina]|uniref:ZZ-type zinc finger-containing protein 3 n=1 Tax=Bombina bombina TaxID=8345 RepID=UPI00235A4B75|nr:ZZ-type zinc finger-containing protein 3 [Bombina bombina]XP_053549310.1 ZZ-type zinc finger-containing protein 3 [Bombina bombina]